MKQLLGVALKLFGGLAALVAAGVVGSFGFLWIEHGRDLTLPVPTGPRATHRKPFDMLVEGNENVNWLGGRDSSPRRRAAREATTA